MSSNEPGPYAQAGPQHDPRNGPQNDPPAPGGPPARSGAGGRRGRVVGIVAGALVVAAGAATAGWFLFGPGSETAYKLTTPRTVAGSYARDGRAVTGDGTAFGSRKVPGMTTSADVNAKYKAGMLKQLQLGGAYGEVENPAKAVDWVLGRTSASLKLRTGATAQGRPRAFHPAGFDGDVLKCREYKVQSMGLAVCVWGDSSTVGTVSSFELAGGDKTLPVNLKRTAALTAKVRKDALVAKKD